MSCYIGLLTDEIDGSAAHSNVPTSNRKPTDRCKFQVSNITYTSVAAIQS